MRRALIVINFLYLLAVPVLTIMFNQRIGYAVSVLVFILLLFLLIIELNEVRKDKKNKKAKMTLDINSEIEVSPIPFFVLDDDGMIVWSNKKFKEISQVESVNNRFISDVIRSFEFERLTLDEKYTLNYRDNIYDIIMDKAYNTVYGNVTKIYLINSTERENLLNTLFDRELVIGIIYIDNFEDVFGMDSNIEQNKSMSVLDDHIYSLSNSVGGFAEKIDDYKYLLFFQRKYLEFLESRKFEILDDIKKIDFGGTVPITMSIGVGYGGSVIKENYHFAKNAMDLALSRGGDQAVVKCDDKIKFYGGKTEAVEKRAKVKARVVAHAIRGIIDQSDDIFIMGHMNPDLDCFGAAIGMYRLAKSRRKNAYIVLDRVSASIYLIHDNIMKSNEEYKNIIITSKEAKRMINDRSLCIVVDTHKYNYVESEEVVRKIDNRIVIDHHRIGSNQITEVLLSYIETYASSTCELVAELISYIADDEIIPKVEAEAMLAGIALDTKQFSVKTGVRTFEAAAFLKRKGADTEVVRELFRTNMRDLKIKSLAIEKAEVLEDSVAIAKIDDQVESANLIASQTSDELLNTTSMKATFVFSKIEGGTQVSARSSGEVNVQSVMEGVGGGGHLNCAGARMMGINMEEAIAQVKELIYEEILNEDSEDTEEPDEE